MKSMTRRALGALAAAAVMTVSGLAPAAAQDYPVDKVTIVVPFSAGGSADRMSRAISRFLPEELGVPVVAVNRPGGNTALGHSYFMQQPDDGSTVLVSPLHPYLVGNILRGEGDLNWEDFAPINVQWQDYYILLVPKDSPFDTAEELFTYVRENPGEATSAIVGGDGGYLSTLLIQEALGLDADAVNFVTYDGGGTQRAAIAGSQVTMSTPSALGSIVIAGESKALAVFRDDYATDEEWKDVPPINEALAPLGIEIPVIPADTRTLAVHSSFKENYPDRYEMLVDAYKRMLERDDFKAFVADGAIGGDWVGPEETARRLQTGYDIFEKYISYMQ